MLELHEISGLPDDDRLDLILPGDPQYAARLMRSHEPERWLVREVGYLRGCDGVCWNCGKTVDEDGIYMHLAPSHDGSFNRQELFLCVSVNTFDDMRLLSPGFRRQLSSFGFVYARDSVTGVWRFYKQCRNRKGLHACRALQPDSYVFNLSGPRIGTFTNPELRQETLNLWLMPNPFPNDFYYLSWVFTNEYVRISPTRTLCSGGLRVEDPNGPWDARAFRALSEYDEKAGAELYYS